MSKNIKDFIAVCFGLVGAVVVLFLGIAIFVRITTPDPSSDCKCGCYNMEECHEKDTANSR